MAKERVNALVEGGRATAAPPLGPSLSPLGVNVGKIVAEINEKTKDFAGIKVPVEIIVDTDKKTWEIKVGTPPTSQLLFKELGIKKGSGKAKEEKAGDATKEIIIKIAKIKKDDMGTKTLAGSIKSVIGTCVSAGITIEGKDPKEVIKEVEAGAWDNLLK